MRTKFGLRYAVGIRCKIEVIIDIRVHIVWSASISLL